MMEIFNNTGPAAVVNNAVQEMWVQAEKLRALTNDFATPFEQLDPNVQHVVSACVHMSNEAAGILNRIGHNTVCQVFSKAFPAATAYVQSVITFTNHIYETDEGIKEKMAQLAKLHAPPPPVDNPEAANQQQAAA